MTALETLRDRQEIRDQMDILAVAQQRAALEQFSGQFPHARARMRHAVEAATYAQRWLALDEELRALDDPGANGEAQPPSLQDPIAP